jgi:hypothetical protein
MIILILLFIFFIALALACMGVLVVGGLAVIALWVLLLGSFISMLMKRTWASLFWFLLLLNTCFGTPYRAYLYLFVVMVGGIALIQRGGGIQCGSGWILGPDPRAKTDAEPPSSTRYLTPDPWAK